ncbi:MAG: MbcA/ParS/Xre antitoxin family protein [Trueperaceae bacterium]|nr:MbcA/ParS/Xre antitoxin family protein [Trueperaceae bacterium]
MPDDDARTYAWSGASNEPHGDESYEDGMLGRILDDATRVLGSEEEARRWLHTQIVSLGGRRPIEHLTSLEGYERVKNTLAKIEHGMY